MLSAQGVGKRFGATVALDGVDFSVQAGEVHALVGENGSGKSTLVRIVAGAESCDAGTLQLDGAAFSPTDPRHARACGIAMIHQELSLCEHLSVTENVMLGIEQCRFGWLKRSDQDKAAKQALAQLGHGDIDLNAPAGQFPLSVRQSIEIARALATGSKVIVFDEPTSSLTQSDAAKLFTIIDMLKASGRAVVYISHFFDEIRRVSDRFTVLRDGRNAGTGQTADYTDDQIIAMMVGRELSELYPRSKRVPGDVVLSIEGMSGVAKPSAATLEVRAGEVIGIAGLSGAGRSELLRCIFGLEPVRSGRITVLAHEGFTSPARRWDQGIGFVSEDRKRDGLALNMSVAENTLLTCLPAWVSPGWEAAAAQSSIDRLSIKTQGPHQPVGALSGGNQQKVAMARLLAHNADVYLLDEPTRGIDVGSKEQIYKQIDEAASNGRAVLMVSSYLPELLGVCDRIAVMSRGKLGQACDAADCSQETLLQEAVS